MVGRQCTCAKLGDCLVSARVSTNQDDPRRPVASRPKRPDWGWTSVLSAIPAFHTRTKIHAHTRACIQASDGVGVCGILTYRTAA